MLLDLDKVRVLANIVAMYLYDIHTQLYNAPCSVKPLDIALYFMLCFTSGHNLVRTKKKPPTTCTIPPHPTPLSCESLLVVDTDYHITVYTSCRGYWLTWASR